MNQPEFSSLSYLIVAAIVTRQQCNPTLDHPALDTIWMTIYAMARESLLVGYATVMSVLALQP